MRKRAWIGLAAAAATVLSLGAGAPAAFAQPAAERKCAVKGDDELKLGGQPMGRAVRKFCQTPSLVEDGDDYGGVHIEFTPPPDPIPVNFRPAGIFSRLFTQTSLRAIVLLDISVKSPALGLGEGLPVATIPLAEYEYSRDRNGIIAKQVTEFADRLAVPRFRVERDMVVHASVRVAVTKASGTDIVAAIQPFADLAGSASGGGLFLSPISKNDFLGAFRVIEEGLNKRLNASDQANEAGFDLGFGSLNASNLTYEFRLAPAKRECKKEFPGFITSGNFSDDDNREECERQNSHPPEDAGKIVVQLDRVPSIIKQNNRILNGLPNYDLGTTAGTPQRSAILGVRVTKPQGREDGTLAKYILPDVEEYILMKQREVSTETFERGCVKLRKAIGLDDAGGLPLSIHDKFALYFAMLLNTNNLDRRDIQETRNCIAIDSGPKKPFENYGFALPPQSAAPITNEGMVRPATIAAFGAGNPLWIYLQDGSKTPASTIGPLNVESYTGGKSIEEADFVRGGALSTLVRLGAAHDSLAFIAYLDRDSDGFVDAIASTIWSEKDGEFKATISNGGNDDGCDHYLLTFGKTAVRKAELIACASGISWRAPGPGESAGAQAPVAALGNWEHGITNLKPVIEGKIQS